MHDYELKGLRTCIESNVTKQKGRRRRVTRSLGKYTSSTCNKSGVVELGLMTPLAFAIASMHLSVLDEHNSRGVCVVLVWGGGLCL